MNSQQLHQPSSIAGHTNNRRWQWLGLGLIGSIIAATIAFYSMPVRNPQTQSIQLLAAGSVPTRRPRA